MKTFSGRAGFRVGTLRTHAASPLSDISGRLP
jgi:hypothetical protein